MIHIYVLYLLITLFVYCLFTNFTCFVLSVIPRPFSPFFYVFRFMLPFHVFLPYDCHSIRMYTLPTRYVLSLFLSLLS